MPSATGERGGLLVESVSLRRDGGPRRGVVTLCVGVGMVAIGGMGKSPPAGQPLADQRRAATPLAEGRVPRCCPARGFSSTADVGGGAQGMASPDPGTGRGPYANTRTVAAPALLGNHPPTGPCQRLPNTAEGHAQDALGSCRRSNGAQRRSGGYAGGMYPPPVPAKDCRTRQRGTRKMREAAAVGATVHSNPNTSRGKGHAGSSRWE